MHRTARPIVFRVAPLPVALALVLFGLGFGDGVVAQSDAPAPTAAPLVLSTSHFAFYSDPETNLNDALIAAGRNRRAGETELFQAGDDEAACFDALPAAERAGWDRAVDYYAEIVSPHETADHEQVVPRLSLAGVVPDAEWGLEDLRYVTIVRGFRAAARPAYESCRWPAQDGANRRWIEALARLLAKYETTLGTRLAEVFAAPWQGLPLRVDVVERADWSGAHTLNLRPLGAHTLISSSNPGYQGLSALEMVFHEACHSLTRRGTPLPAALQAASEAGNPFRGSLVHAVHFWMTGEVVRRTLAAAGETAYTPSMYALGLFDRGAFRTAIESTWPAYLDGKKTLQEAANDLLEALRQAAEPK